MERQLSNHNLNLGLKATTVGIKAISTLFSLCGLLLSGNSTVAQIIPDNTLPTNSVTLPNGNLIEITGGTTAGSNLFHSFQEFSLSQGNTAWFNNVSNIENIITRVTGGSISSIDGLIRANGTANLFLINPNGIIFGENASLDIGGSFLGSTADSLKFSDGSEFSAVNPEAPPLLTVNIPLGLQYGTGNGEIVVQGQGNSLQFNPDFTLNSNNRPVGLQVDQGQTLALVGKNVNLSGGNLTAEAGNIELGSVGDNSLVKLTPTSVGWTLDYTEASNFQNINLDQAASLDVSGNRGGDVTLQGKQVIITDGSAILANTLGDRDGGKVQVNASELLVLAGTSLELPFVSLLSTDVLPGATGNGSDIELNTSSLIVADGAQIFSSTYSSGDTGNITVQADSVELISGSPILGSSGLFTLVFGSGKGGDINLEANNISVLGGAQIGALTFGSGTGGSIAIQADSIELTGGTPDSPSGIFSAVLPSAEGNGGNLTIETGSLKAVDGGQIAVSTAGLGNGGELNITANTIDLIGGSEFGASGILGNAFLGTGDGGDVRVDTGNLTIQDGATISTSNFHSRRNLPPGQGAAGNILINANSIKLDRVTSKMPSSITAATNNSGGGAITINVSDNITLNNGSQITADTLGKGDGGSIGITGKTININSNAEVSANSTGLGQAGNITLTGDDGINLNQGNITATSVETGGGNIKLGTDFLFLENNSLISTSVFDSTGGGGNIVIESDYVIAQSNSDIRANAVFGQGGNIDILTEVILLSADSEIDASSKFGLDGVVEIKNPDSQKQVEVIQVSTEIVDPTALITANCPVAKENIMVVTGKGGLAENPSQTLRGQSVWEDLRDFSVASTRQQPVALTQDSVSSESTETITEAEGWIVNPEGNVQLVSYASFNQCKK